MLSERLKARLGYVEQFISVPRADLERAASVCAVVEAFQAAEQELDKRIENGSVLVRHVKAYRTAKARLLEVNLG